MNAEANGAPVSHHFSANSIYDPNLSGGGHQPLGRDQYGLVYDHYTVIGSKMKVTFFSTRSEKQSVTMWCGTCLQDTQNTLTSLSEILEQGNANGGLLLTHDESGQQSGVHTQFYSPKKMFHMGKGSIVSNPRVCASMGGNPTEDAVYTLLVVQPGGSSVDPNSISALVEIEYIVTFSERKTLEQS